MTKFMNVFVKLAEGFTGIVSSGGENLMFLPGFLFLVPQYPPV